MWMKTKWRWLNDDYEKKNLKRKRNPADRASYFTVITQFICTQQQKSLILNLFPFEFFLNSLKKTSINFPVRNFWKSLLQYITIYLSTRKRKNNNPQLLYFSCLLLLYCRSIIHYYTILSFCNKNYSMFYCIRKKKIENYRFHQNRKSKKCYCITTTTTTSTTTYYYYIENVPLCKKQRSLCVLSWCLNTTTITRDSILFMMGTLNNTKLVFFQKENITKKSNSNHQQSWWMKKKKKSMNYKKMLNKLRRKTFSLDGRGN